MISRVPVSQVVCAIRGHVLTRAPKVQKNVPVGVRMGNIRPTTSHEVVLIVTCTVHRRVKLWRLLHDNAACCAQGGCGLFDISAIIERQRKTSAACKPPTQEGSTTYSIAPTLLQAAQRGAVGPFPAMTGGGELAIV